VKVLVTGANGLIGANLVRELLDRDVEVRGLVRASSDLSALTGLDVELHHADLVDGGPALRDAVRDCKFVFHTAMYFSYERARGAELQAAVRGTENLLRAAALAGVERFVLTSSSVVFGYTDDGRVLGESDDLASTDRENLYVSAKIRQHRLAMDLGAQLGLETLAVCPAVSIGPHGTRLGPSNGMILGYLSDPWRLTYPGGCNLVSTVDVAAGHWLVARHGTPGDSYILGAENLEWPAIHRMIAELAGVAPPRGQLTHGLSYLAAAAEELRARLERRSPLGNRDQAAMVGRYYWYSHARAEAIGYRPVGARRALAVALSWLAASPHVSRELRAGLRLHDEVYAVRWPKLA